MVKKGRSPHDGFYKIGSGSNQVPRETLFELRKTTYASRFFVKTVQKAIDNASKYGLKVAKSRVRRAGNGIIHKGNKPIQPKVVVAVYPGKLCVNGKLPVKDAWSDYVMNIGKYRCQGKTIDLVLVGKASENAWDCNNVNHSCKPNCKFVRFSVKNGVRLEGLETIRTIQPGEELTADYGLAYFRPLKDIPDDPGFRNLVCGCGHCPYPRAQQCPV
jgi:hypothetical protein